MKLGLDIHGVIDKDPGIFNKITHQLLDKNETNQVHIITGARYTKELIDGLASNGVVWTHFFSITDHHRNIGTYMQYKNDDSNQPVIDDYLWDKTKAMYCRNERIDLHIDDSAVYGEYFKGIHTEYIHYGNNLSGIFSMVANN